MLILFIYIILVPNLLGFQLPSMHGYEIFLHTKTSVSNKLCLAFHLSTVAIILVLQKAKCWKARN
jgi:hypothetical protein